uniref:X globin n=1 Tax=Cynoglossus semilaevis TaxID=244447 RepID=A0A3P8UIR6_CYNSE
GRSKYLILTCYAWQHLPTDVKRVGKAGVRGEGVMSFIEKSVARLDQLDRLEALALELGKSHFHYNASPKYYSYVGAEFICAVQPILKERWTPELEEAWKTMFQYITNLMRQGYHEESCRQRHLTSAPHRRVFVHSVFTVLFSTLIVCRHFQHFVSLM